MATGQYEKINVRGVDFLNVTLDEAAALGRGMLSGDRLYAVFTPNAEIVQMCVEQPSYYALAPTWFGRPARVCPTHQKSAPRR